MANAKSDVEHLMNEVLPFAERMLAEHAEFFPYAAGMKLNGDIVSVAGYDGRERPPSTEIIDLLKTELRKDAVSGKFTATAIVYDVRVLQPGRNKRSNAIAVALDHCDDYSTVVLFPYSISDGTVTIGEPFAETGDNATFP